MLLQQASALLLAVAGTAHALDKVSPFFMLTSNQFSHASKFSSKQMVTAANVEIGVLDALSGCAKAATETVYFVANVPGVTAHDIRDGSKIPNLRQRIQKSSKDAVIEIVDVIGEVNTEQLVYRIESQCDAPIATTSSSHEGKSRIVELNDASELDSQIRKVEARGAEFVLIFTAAESGKGGRETPPYEMDEQYPESLHMDLRRNLNGDSHQARAARNSTNPQDGLPLFEKYQFLSPGIFMGLSVSLLLFLILYVGISAIAGLEVSYMAFSKEMGAQAQKGKQQ